MDIIIIGLLLGGTYALMAMGLQLQYGVARIMNLANGEVLIAGAFGTFWFFTATRFSPFWSLLFVVPLAFAVNWAIYQVLILSAGQTREEPGPPRGRQHSRHLRPELHSGRTAAGHVRWRISQLLLSGRALSSSSASATDLTASWHSSARRYCALASMSGCIAPALGSLCAPWRSIRRRRALSASTSRALPRWHSPLAARLRPRAARCSACF